MDEVRVSLLPFCFPLLISCMQSLQHARRKSQGYNKEPPSTSLSSCFPPPFFFLQVSDSSVLRQTEVRIKLVRTLLKHRLRCGYSLQQRELAAGPDGESYGEEDRVPISKTVGRVRNWKSKVSSLGILVRRFPKSLCSVLNGHPSSGLLLQSFLVRLSVQPQNSTAYIRRFSLSFSVSCHRCGKSGVRGGRGGRRAPDPVVSVCFTSRLRKTKRIAKSSQPPQLEFKRLGSVALTLRL
ncbi:hypothetical protein QBC35DRAFT_215813 [Podospora australis]|uniref:Uncharacterized protein n=1 Tax=Podospora australis TaxID=1536484 RepID=A0AAN7AIL8_9PEZI|nr:hypothetical protein QBC35DRAFT_215813 [Podospora australis]